MVSQYTYQKNISEEYIRRIYQKNISEEYIRRHTTAVLFMAANLTARGVCVYTPPCGRRTRYAGRVCLTDREGCVCVCRVHSCRWDNHTKSFAMRQVAMLCQPCLPALDILWPLLTRTRTLSLSLSHSASRMTHDIWENCDWITPAILGG
jgi:hypothetical protein